MASVSRERSHLSKCLIQFCFRKNTRRTRRLYLQLLDSTYKPVDPLDNEQISVSFKPLYEAMHIYSSLNKAEELRRTYDADRRKQMDLLLPSSIILDENGTQLYNLLADITGFAILERATASRTQEFRSASEIEGLWDLMCAQVIDLITDAVAKINNPKVLLNVKESVTLFMQTINVLLHKSPSYFH